MCGIIGVTGRDDAVEVLMRGLARLEYRGYDSAGIVVANGELEVVKREGKLSQLEGALEGRHPDGGTGLGHTRWATHGPPSDRNAHPHLDPGSAVAVVHNGIIENYEALRRSFDDDRSFLSQTDT
jgi:glutamine---fructose-6-phosphate transaminase (isomerizing)